MPSQRTGRLGIALSVGFVLFGPSFASSAVKSVQPIKRHVAGLTLGMSEADFLASQEAEVVEQDAEIRHRVYRLRAAPDADLRDVTAHFFEGRLLKIDLEFAPEFVRAVDWFDLVERFAGRYGTGRITQTESPRRVTDLVDWTDDRTHLVLRHAWQPLRDGRLDSTYRVTYMDFNYYVQSLRVKPPFAALPPGAVSK